MVAATAADMVTADAGIWAAEGIIMAGDADTDGAIIIAGAADRIAGGANEAGHGKTQTLLDFARCKSARSR